MQKEIYMMKNRQENLLDNLLEKYPYIDPNYVGAFKMSVVKETFDIIWSIEQNSFNHNFRPKM